MENEEVDFVLEDSEMVRQIIENHLIGIKTVDFYFDSDEKHKCKFNLCGRCNKYVSIEQQYCGQCGGAILW